MSGNNAEFFLPYMPHISTYKQEFDSLNSLLGKTTLTGKISSLSIAENLFVYMEETKEKFNILQDQLIEILVNEIIGKACGELTSLSQVTIDMLIRNLFERTADVGFLATDSDIRDFLAKEAREESDMAFMQDRLDEYVKKYSVYDNILLFDANGMLVFSLDSSIAPEKATDPLVGQTLQTNQEYIETFRPSALQPQKETALIYSAPVKSADGNTKLGVLCLCFKIKDEMDRVFKSLTQGRSEIILALLDEKMNIITSSHPRQFASVSRIPAQSKMDLVQIRNRSYLGTVAKTGCYQGYCGSEWMGAALAPVQILSKKPDAEAETFADYIDEDSSLMEESLKKIIEESENLLEDLGDVVINGEIIASKKRSYELNPVLDNVRSISNKINDLSVQAIRDLLSTVFLSHRENIRFYATLGVDIMDRNLYERANDCRWWALTGAFRQILAKPQITTEEANTLETILQYINGLYTVYTNLFLFDKNGQIVAVSNANERHFVGDKINDSLRNKIIANHDTQKYLVSDFETSKYYQNRSTYIYYATVLSMDSKHSSVGGIGIVFDSEPEFKAMLKDCLPRGKDGLISEQAYGLFLDKNQRIVSSTSEKHQVGDVYEIDGQILSKSAEKGVSQIIEQGDKTLLIGCKKSFGYREYKRHDHYTNDIYALLVMEL